MDNRIPQAGDPAAFEEPIEIVMQDDGSAELILEDVPVETAHSDNLAETMSEKELRLLADDLLQSMDQYLSERKDWEDTFKEGLQILGIKLEEVDHPFPGACAAHSPLMLEAALQFQARAITELFPADGPVKARVMGQTTPELQKQAERVKEFMNYQLTEEMEEYFEEHDTMLFNLPLAGSAFKKTMFDHSLKRPTSRFVPAEDMIVPYSASDLRTTPRYGQRVRMEHNDLLVKQANGFYRDIDLSLVPPSLDEIQEEKASIAGQSPGIESSLHELYEIYADLILEGDDLPKPYVVTVDKDSAQVLAVRRNWQEDSTTQQKDIYHTHYKLFPGLGFYGFGLVHVLGNLQKSATAVTRALVDSGQFANLQGGFKARGLRMEGDDKPIKFGEFRNVEGYGDDIRKSIVPLPTKEPSQTLLLMLGKFMEDGRRLASVSDLAPSDSNSETPVGTTLAVMEQGIKVMSAIHKRLHRAQRAEFKILARINSLHLPDEYPFTVAGQDQVIAAADFDSKVDVIPVSDPNIFSESQRIVRAQTQLQLAQQFPEQHDIREALRRMHEVIGSQNIDDVLLPERGPKPMDPATELYALMNGAPIKAYPFQSHEAHIAAHQGQAQMLMGMAQQNPLMQQAGQMLAAHVAEHEAFKIRMQIEAMTGQQLPAPPDYNKTNPNKDDGWTPLPPQIEYQIAQMQAQAFTQLAQLQQQAAAAQQQQDPQFQLMVKKVEGDIQTKMAAVQQKAQSDQSKMMLELKKHTDKMMLEMKKLQDKMVLEREQMIADMRTVVMNQNHNDVQGEKNFQRELAKPKPAPKDKP
jgi:chaperonin GroES